MRFFSFIVALITTLVAFGTCRTDSVNVLFRVGQSHFDPSLGENGAVMNDFVANVRSQMGKGGVERIVIYGYASPDGQPKANERLASNRCASLAEYIASHTGVNRALIEQCPEGIGWTELRRLVATNPDVPHRDEVIDILDNTPLQVLDSRGRVVDGRKKQLMDLAGGRAWKWLTIHLFPQIRNAIGISFYTNETSDRTEELNEGVIEKCVEAKETGDQTVELQDASGEAKAPEAIQEQVTEVISIYESDDASIAHVSSGSSDESVNPLTESSEKTHSILALKTNLLYYGLLLPNAELEWLINKHWSVAVEGNVAWWGSYKKERSYRLALLDAEGRYWIKPRAPWHGMYVGLIAGGGWYDIEKGTPGHYGWGLMSGVTFGYMWPVTRTLSLEAGIGAGYAHIVDKEYEPIEGHHVYLRTRKINYFGPVKLNFSLVWRFLDRKKPIIANPAS